MAAVVSCICGRCFHCPTCLCSGVFEQLSALSPDLIQDLINDIEELQARVASLRGRLIHARRRHNATLRVSRLPPEILGDIFLYTRDTSDDCRWLAISQTHHSWRSVALSQCRLWSVLDMSYPEPIFEEMIGRAGGMPLRLKVYAQGKGRTLQPEDIVRHLSLWDNIEPVNVNTGFAIWARSEVFPVIFPRIQTAPSRITSLYLQPSLSSELVLPPEILDGHYPCLKVLRLGHHIPDWGRSLYSASSLRILFIKAADESPPYSFDRVVAALRSLPMLEVLKLYCCLPWKGVRGSPIPTTAEQFLLPRLRLFRVEGRPQSCVRLCQYLRFPPRCSTHIYCTHRCDTGEQAPLIKLTLASSARIQGCYLDSQRAVKIFASEHRGVQKPFCFLHLQIRENRAQGDDFDDFMKTFSNALADVETDTLSLVPVSIDHETDPWVCFDGATAKVIHIDWTLREGSLERSSELELGGGFHGMETLVLEGLDMHDADFPAELLIRELQGRIERSGHFRTLQLVNCDVPDELIDALCRIIPEVARVHQNPGEDDIGCWVRRMAKYKL